MQETVYELMPKDPYAFNQGLIELGATHCRPRQPRCDLCPVKQFCHGYQQGTLEFLPNKPKKEKAKGNDRACVFVSRQPGGAFCKAPIRRTTCVHVEFADS